MSFKKYLTESISNPFVDISKIFNFMSLKPFEVKVGSGLMRKYDGSKILKAQTKLKSIKNLGSMENAIQYIKDELNPNVRVSFDDGYSKFDDVAYLQIQFPEDEDNPATSDDEYFMVRMTVSWAIVWAVADQINDRLNRS